MDIRDNELFAIGQVLPQQGDLIHIPAEGPIPAEGDFEVTDADRNARRRNHTDDPQVGAVMWQMSLGPAPAA